jgi:hypothetical protein
VTIIPVPEFAPDLPDLPSVSSDTVFNVLPISEVSYGPLPSHQPFSSALTARCQGGLTASDNSGNVRVYAGDATKLYRIASPGTTSADVSKVGGYTTSSVQPWSFTILGQRVIATNFNDAPQGYLEGTSALFSDLITSGVTSLKAKYAAVVKNWLFLANTTDATYGNQPQRVWWSAIGDPTNFPTPGTQLAANNLSDFQDTPGPQGAINGISGNLGTADGAIFFERAVWRAIYTGLPDIFSFIPAEGARGLLTNGGLNQFGNKVAYPTEDGFYLFDGTNSAPIGKGKIDRFFYNDLQTGYLDRVSCCSDPSRGLMIWAYPGAGASNGNPNRLLIYSEAFNKWTATEASTVQIEYLLRGATFGKTLEQLDAFGTVDSLAFSMDSPVWQGNRSILAAFDTSHKYGYFDGANLPAKIDTTDMEIIPGTQSSLTRARPLVDLSTATLATASRDSIKDTVTYGTAQTQEANGSCPLRGRGRYHRVRFQSASGASWTQFSGIDVEQAAPVGGYGAR